MATKTATISARISALVVNGATPIEALNAVCGKANVDQMISDLYDQLRAKATQIAEIRAEHAKARHAYETASTRVAKQAAAESLEFWSNKLSFLECAK